MDYEEPIDDAILDGLARMMHEASQGVFIANPKRIKDVVFCFQLLQKILKGNELKITYAVSSKECPFAGDISVSSRSLEITDPTAFSLVCRICSNMELLLRTDGIITLDLMFYGTARKISA